MSKQGFPERSLSRLLHRDLVRYTACRHQRLSKNLHQIAVEWGRIAAIRPRGDIDGLIAATAIVHDLILVTRNVKDFEDTGASVISPWETSA